MTQPKYYVYILIDTRSKTDRARVFYVGKGQGPREEEHLKLHARWVKQGKPTGQGYNLHKLRKIGQILKAGLEVQSERVSYFEDEQEALDYEQSLIVYYGLENLTNILPYGELGSKTGVSRETRDKISKANTGKKRSPQTRARIAASQKRWWGEHPDEVRLQKHSEESKVKMSVAAKGKKCSLETRERISKAKKGVKLGPVSEETRQRMSEVGKKWAQDNPEKVQERSENYRGRKHSEETKRKMSEVKRGKKVSAETRQRMSDGQKGRKHSAESRKKQGDTQRGRKRGPMSEEHKMKIREGFAKRRKEQENPNKSLLRIQP